MLSRNRSPYFLKTRIALLALAFLLAGMWALALYAGYRLYQDMRGQLEAQQSSEAALLSRELERSLRERGNALQLVARGLADDMARGAAVLQGRLAERSVLQQMFRGGYYVTDGAGAAIAAYPPHLGVQRRGGEASRFMQQALAGQTVISDPMPGLVADAPIVIVATPVPGASGHPVGVLAGVVRLRDIGVWDVAPSAQGSPHNDYWVVDRATRTIVAGSDPRRLMQALPAPGQDPVLDRFVAGAEGSIVHTFDGVRVLASVRQMAEPGWIVAVSQPTAQAFAPLEAMRQRIVVATLVLTVLAAWGIWWMLRRALRPLEHMARRMGAMARQEEPLQPLPPRRARELDQLVQGFNHLLAELEQRQRAVRESQERYRAAFMTSPDALDITRVSDGAHLDVNEGFERLFGWPRAEVLGRSGLGLGIWRESDAGVRARLVQQVLAQGRIAQHEQVLRRRDGSMVTVRMAASLLDVEGEPCLLWVTQDVTAYLQAHAQIQRLTSTDALTGLPNLQQFMLHLAQAQARCLEAQHLGALLCIDLDDFKTVNDSMGHDHGDQLLRMVAGRLQEALGPEGVVARLGGDEFIVLLDGLPAQFGEAAHAAQAMAYRLSERLGEALPLDGTVHNPGVGVGILVFGQAHQAPKELLRQAVLALNQAKHTGPGAILFFEPQMQDQVSSRARLQRSLREALQKQTFALHYQPQLADSGAVVGVEALVRWHLQGHGMVPPAEFIPLAEKTGLILPLGRWILHTACAQLAAWARAPGRMHLSMAVNVSAGQFQQDDFVQQVQEVLAETGAPAHRLKIELTESLMMCQIEDVIARMKALRDLGVRFSLDDFGTGFSSLSYLKRLPLDQLKIDQGFVRDILEDHNDAAIARTVIALGESLGLEVIAEGVETPAHREALARWGCRYYQGYLFSKPLPLAQLEDYLDQQPAPALAP